MAEAAEGVLSKSEFARLINVTPGRVSQMIGEGKIGDDALVGDGRSAKIRVELAKAQLRQRTDISQRFGNGLSTLLDPAGAEPPKLPPAQREPSPREAADPVAEAIKAERLRELTLRNERAAEERLAERGRYVRADQTQAAMTRLASAMLNVFEGGLQDLANALAAKHGLATRDVLHQLRQEFRGIRERAANAVRVQAAHLPPLLLDDVVDASDPELGRA